MGLVFRGKPRLKRAREHYMQQHMWLCHICFVSCYGATPQGAYKNWRGLMLAKGIRLLNDSSGSRQP